MSKVNVETGLNCSNKKDIKHCVGPWPCGVVQPAEIYCTGEMFTERDILTVPFCKQIAIIETCIE